MAFQYTFKLNGEPLYATLGAMVSEKLEEPLDESNIHIPITVRDVEYKMLGLLEITGTDGTITKNFTYLILSDTVKDISKSGFYSHDLTAVEYTVGLDYKLIHTLTFTEPFLQKTRAPFYFNFGESSFRASFPRVELDANYYIDEYTTIGNLGTAVLPTPSIYDSNIVYARYRVNGGTWTSQVNVSASTLAITFSTKGTYEVQIGLVGISSDGVFYPAYTHYIKVLDEVRYTLYDMIQRIRNVVPLERSYYHEDTRIFDLDDDLVARFQNIAMPQMFIQKQTLRQTLNTMFKYINAISRLHYMSEGNDVLSIDEFNKITGSFDGANIASFESQQDAQQYGTKAISWLEQSLQSNFRDNPSVKTPAQDLFKTVRSSDVQLTDVSYEIKLEKPIYELSKFEVKIPKIEITILDSLSEPHVFTYNDKVLDITQRMLEKTWWNLKLVTNDIFAYSELQAFDTNVGLRPNKNGNGFWVRNSNVINFNLRIGFLQKENLFMEVIKEAVNEEITLATKEYITNMDSFPITSISVDITNGLNSSKDFRNLSFNIEYVTLENPTLKVDRADVSSINYDTDIRINQNTRFTDFGRMSRDAYGQLQRSAVPNHTLTKIHTSFDDVWDVGTVDSHGYIITKRHIAFYNEFIEVTYEATLDHNRLNEFNGINQEYRAFEIPKGNQAYERHDFYGDYVLITGPNISFGEDVTVVKESQTIPLLFERLIDVETDPTKITSAFVWTDGFAEVYPDATGEYFALLTPVVSHGGKGGLVFTFGFDNNQVAGDALYKDTNIYNQPVRYTNEQGFFNELWFGMINQYTPTDAFLSLETREDAFNDGYAYPLVKDASGDFGQTFIMSLGDSRANYGSPLLYDTLQVYKDSSENYKLSYQISIMPYNYKEFVIGQYFYTDNRLVRNKGDNDSKLYLYRYKDGTFYNKFDDLLVKILDGSVEDTDYDIVELVGNTNIFYNNMTLYFDSNATVSSASGHTSWAIVDENGNLYLACNKPYNTIYIHAKHFRPNSLYIGNKEYPDSAMIVRTYLTSSYTPNSTIVFGETTSASISNGINYYILANGIKNIFIYGSASLNYVMSSSITFGDEVNLGEISNGINYYVLANVGKYLTITGSASIKYTFEASETIGTTNTISSISSGINYYVLENYSINATYWTVYFLDYDASVLKTEQVLEGSDATPPANPTRTGYTFTGWGGDYTGVIQDEVIVAMYTANTYTVTFNPNGGIVSPTSKTVTFGSTYGTLATTSRTGYIFNGWFTASSGGTQVTSGTTVNTANNHTLYAQWTPNVTVGWVAGGTAPTTYRTCADIDDVNNVRCDVTCSWEYYDGPFLSMTDDSTNPQCSGGATRTVCTKSGGKFWQCYVEEGKITYTNCETCEVTYK